MKETILSNAEKSFIQKIISGGHRLDGRNYNETRNLQIAFGSDYGSCIVSLGETKVLAQVSCEVVQPKQIRPNEGILYINVEISPMAAPQFEANRQTDLTVYLNRLLEKCYKDSKCIDLESLCIVVEEKVWSLRVDIKVLNHEGNLIECSSIATLTALAHFKRPDVTRIGDKVIIHTVAEKDPIPTVLYHYPVCLTFAIFGSNTLLSDPSYMEESVCMSSVEEGNAGGGLLVVGMNQYKEPCLLDLTGAAISNVNIVHKAILSASERGKFVVDLLKKAIISDDTLSTLLSDPSYMEESVCMSSVEEGNAGGGLLVVGMNQYKEPCLLDLTGAAISNVNIVHKAILSASERGKFVVDLLKKAIISDDTLRQKRVRINYADIITNEHKQSLIKKDLSICLKNYNTNDVNVGSDNEMEDVKMEPSKYDIIPTLPKTAEIKAKTATSSWIEISSESEEEI